MFMGSDGEVKQVELGPALEPLMKAGDWFMDRLAVVSEIGKPILGISDGGQRSQFGPHEQMINKMRKSRQANPRCWRRW